MSRLIFLSAGHSNGRGASKDRGAVVPGTGIYEGDLAIKCRDRIADICRNTYGLQVIEDRDEDALAQTLTFFRTLVRPDSINLDIHFNAAANPAASGCEAFIKDITNPFQWVHRLASRIVAGVCQHTKMPNRGVRPESMSARKRLGWMTLTGHNILLEVCFLTNPKDMRDFDDAFEDICSSVALELRNAALQKS
jgi:N-acetylmuramoyl-L-alanine amidase